MTLNWSCLTREQKEDIAICFAQNDECHRQLANATAEPAIAETWEVLSLVAIAGIAGGLILAQQVRH